MDANLVGALHAEIERFVAKGDRCWPWSGPKDGKGYGRLYLGGNRYIGAHRAAFLLANGSLSRGLVVMHDCDNPLCCNPAHLREGTQAENLRDMTAKGRRRSKPIITHCRHGHQLSGENIILYAPRIAGGAVERGCRECGRNRSREFARVRRRDHGDEVRAYKRALVSRKRAERT